MNDKTNTANGAVPEVKEKSLPKATELLNLLESNQSKKVSEVIEKAREINARRGAGNGGGGRQSNHTIWNTDGVVVAKRCGYYERWFLIGALPGAEPWSPKTHSTDGLSQKCNEGNQKWNKRNAEIKAYEADIKNNCVMGVIKSEEAQKKLNKEDPANAKHFVHTFEKTDRGFATREDVIVALEKNKVAIDAARSNIQ